MSRDVERNNNNNFIWNPIYTRKKIGTARRSAFLAPCWPFLGTALQIFDV